MNTLTNLVKIALTAETLGQKISNVYGDGSIYINGEKLMLADFGSTQKSFDAALYEAREAYYEKEEELQDEKGGLCPDVRNELLAYIETL
jgi:hypothetical protein